MSISAHVVSAAHLNANVVSVILSFMTLVDRCVVGGTCRMFQQALNNLMKRELRIDELRALWSTRLCLVSCHVFHASHLYEYYTCSRMLSIDDHLIKEYKKRLEGPVKLYVVIAPDKTTTYYLMPYYKRFRITKIEAWIIAGSFVSGSLAGIIPKYNVKRKISETRIYISPGLAVGAWWNLFPTPFMNNADANDLLKRAIRKG
jgi:hypothetical protein